jgi:hypothetical protein
MTRSTLALLFVLLLVLTTACTKRNVLEDAPGNPLVNPGNGSKPNGFLYISTNGLFTKINTIDSAEIWSASIRNLFASFDNPMVFDSSSFYHGNYSAFTSYSLQTGIPRWSFSWIAFNDAPVFQPHLQTHGTMPTYIVLTKRPGQGNGKRKLIWAT